MGRSGRRDTCRRLKGKNELSGICHDFTRLSNDKVMNVNDGCLSDVQDADPGHDCVAFNSISPKLKWLKWDHFPSTFVKVLMPHRIPPYISSANTFLWVTQVKNLLIIMFRALLSWTVETCHHLNLRISIGTPLFSTNITKNLPHSQL